MSCRRLAAVAALGGLIASADAQAYWQLGQINSSMCIWEQPRAAVIRDTVYVDGGHLWWVPGLNDGSYGQAVWDGNPFSLMYSFNFNTSFSLDGSANLSALFTPISKALGGTGSGGNLAPNYYDGGLLANDDEFFMYGGLLRQTQAFNSEPDSDEELGYQRFQYGAEKASFEPGFLDEKLSSGVTRYLAYGGAASAPSENLAWYFTGFKSPSGGPIYEVNGNDSNTAFNISNTMITLNMATQQQETWTNTTLPESVPGRANPELVWVPVGERGILVALGGIVLPEWIYDTAISPNEAETVADSDVFMKNINVYDIAGDQWYTQPTDSGPQALGRGCAVVAPAKDSSSYNIYYYGGFNGTDPTIAFNDDVWVLSLPSFTWTMVSSGTPGHARAGHKCFKPYPDQMMVIGGYTALPGASIDCLTGGVIQMFNLTSATWMDGYDPAVYGDYGVPDKIHQVIGGDGAGGATATTPMPSGWATPALASVFQTKYPASKITTWYPYASASTTGKPTVVGTGGNGLPSWLAPVLGVILGLIFVTSLVVIWFLWRRRRFIRSSRGGSEPATEENGVRILSWIRGQQGDAKAPTVTTEGTPASTGDVAEARSPRSPQSPPPVLHRIHEMENTEIAELMDTSPRPELQDTGLSPLDIINKHSHFGTNPSSSTRSGTDRSSLVSHSSGALGGSGTRSRMSSDAAHSAESSLVGATLASVLSGGGGGGGSSPVEAGPPGSSRVASGVSGLSEREVGHLRQISEATVSSTSEAGREAPGTPVAAAGPSGASPISPPSAEERPGGDYLSARGPVSPASVSPGGGSLRKSVFHENRDDLVDR